MLFSWFFFFPFFIGVVIGFLVYSLTWVTSSTPEIIGSNGFSLDCVRWFFSLL